MELDFSQLLQGAIEHPFAIILAVTLLIVFLKRDGLSAFFKDYLDTRNATLDRKTDQLTKLNERYFSLYENSSRALEKISEAIVSFKEGLLSVESRLAMKIDQEMEQVRTEIRNNKIDQLTVYIKEREKSNPGFGIIADAGTGKFKTTD